MTYAENTYYLSKDEIKGKMYGSDYLINQSGQLDDLAAKLTPTALQNAADAHIIRDDKNKTRFSDLLSGLAALFHVMRLSELNADVSTGYNRLPIYLVQDDFDCEKASGFYFFVGGHEIIRQKLLVLTEDDSNLKKNSHGY